MTWPPSPLGTSYADATPTPSTHAGSHNLLGAALNDTIEVLGDEPQGPYTDVESRESAIEQGADGYFDRKLFGWRRALYERDRVRAVILAGPGDSRTEGSGLTDINSRWLNILGRELDARFPTEGYKFTEGYIPSWYASAGLAQDPVRAGNFTFSLVVGFGNRALSLGPSTGSGVGQATFTVEGDNAWFYYTKFSSMGKSEYQVDGGAWVEVDHHVAFFLFFVQGRVEVDLGGPGTHTVVWRFKSAGGGFFPNPVINGIEAFYGAADIGISVIDCGHGGYTAADFLADPNQPTQWVSLTGATLSVVDLGTNEWNGSSPGTIDTDLADYQESMSDLIDSLVDGDADYQIELCGGWTPRASLSTGQPEDWPLFVNVQYGLAADSAAQVSLFDYLRLLPQPDGPGDTDGVVFGFYDTLALHPEDAGHAAMGTGLTEHLSLPKGGAWSAPEPGLAILNLTEKIEDFGGDPINLGTDGQAYLYYKIADGYVSGWLFIGFDDDANFPNPGNPIVIPADALPAPPASNPTPPFGGWIWTGSFGFLTDNASFAFPAVPSVISSGAMVFVLGLASAGGVAALLSDTNPEALAAVQSNYQGGVRYPTETSPATGS